MRPRITAPEYEAVKRYRSKGKVNLLIIPDLHEPFCLSGYFEFVKSIGKMYNTNQTLFLGDLIDSHASSYHESETDAMGIDTEFEEGVKGLVKWYGAFPEADVCIGNHDAIGYRKSKTAGVSKYWMKTYGDALNVSNWNFRDSFTYNNIDFVHGIGGKARGRMTKHHTSVVQGHYHAETYLEFNTSPNRLLFAMQLGTGFDRKSYAARYGKYHPKPFVNCGVILDLYGHPKPIIEHMKL